MKVRSLTLSFFTGEFAQATYLHFLGDVPEQWMGIPLTDDMSHWRKGNFGDELIFQGWVYPYDCPLSEITLWSMSDLGYEVNVWAGDESYVLPSRAAAKMTDQEGLQCHIERRLIRRH